MDDEEDNDNSLLQELPTEEEQEALQSDELALVEQLGVEGLTDILFGMNGRIFSAAGKQAPVAEFSHEGVLLRPPQKPYMEEPAGEVIAGRIDDRGVLLNELGEQRKIVGAKYKGRPIYTLGETKPDTVKHYAAWFDDEWQPHKFYVQGEALTADMVYRIRNRTHDGEISNYPEIKSE